MEMSPSWMAKTAQHLAERGFALQTEALHELDDGALVYAGHRYRLRRPDEDLVLECLEYPTGAVAYWMEILAFHGMSSFSFPLDSWRHRDDRVEFKFQAAPSTAMGLALTLRLPRPT